MSDANPVYVVEVRIPPEWASTLERLANNMGQAAQHQARAEELLKENAHLLAQLLQRGG